MQLPAERTVDLLVVGGGINGTGIARDAAGRGLDVLLCEQDDLASHTSSASTKLIHGGLRYMERLHIGLVRKALREREVVLGSAPHISWPLRFVIPHDERMRSAWMIRIGLVLYDNLARRRNLAASHGIDLRSHAAGKPLRPGFRRGFVYSDGWIDDARLVVLNALDAHEHGAEILTRTRCEHLERDGECWTARLRAQDGVHLVACRAVVNASGPWADTFLDVCPSVSRRHALRLVKGSHIVVPRLFDHPLAYLFQNPDRRVIFAIPYEGSFTLIGTTDVEYRGDPAAVAVDLNEIEYLCRSVSQYFVLNVEPRDVVWSYTGVRALLKDEAVDPADVTRDYTLDLDTHGAPLLNVFGGKITTFRKLAEEAVDRIAPLLGCQRRGWTAGRALPGGDLPEQDFERFHAELAQRYPWLPDAQLKRYAHAYGTRIEQLLGDAGAIADLGPEIVPGLHVRELEYLCDVEWAASAEDVLWRRTKLGLHAPSDTHAALSKWFDGRRAVRTESPSACGVAERVS